MIASLNQLGSSLIGLLGQLSIELAALAIVVVLACRLLRIESPAVRHLLWVAVLLKPVIAMTVSSPWTVFSPVTSSLGLVLPALGHTAAALTVDPIETTAALPSIVNSGPSLTFGGWVAALWMLGSTLLLCRILIGYGVIHRLRRQARIQRDGRLHDALREANLALSATTGVDVATSSAVRSPIVVGVLKPLIVVPVDLPDKLSQNVLKLVLMHELAHVRRFDNLILLFQRLISVALFFHPAVWLCGRLLRQEAEQACDDLVVGATGRSQDYARGLTSLAELARLNYHLKRSVPVMNVFAAVESDLALRIRRALAGRARRMSTRSRVLTALLICGVCAVALPSTGIAGGDDHDFDWSAVKSTPPEEWSEDLKEQILQAVADRMRRGEEKTRIRAEDKREDGVDWKAVQSTPPEEWSQDLKDQIVAAGHDLRAIAQRVRLGQEKEATRESEPDGIDWDAVKSSPPEEWSDDLKARILQFVGQKLGGPRQGVETRTDRDEGSETLQDFQRGVAREAMATPPAEWSVELKARIARAGWDLREFAEGILKRQQIALTERRIRAAVENGDMTPEQGRERLAGVRRELTERSSDTDFDAVERRIRAAVENGDMTPEQGRERLAAAHAEIEARSNDTDLGARERRIRAAIENGDITPEQGRERLAAARRELAAGDGGDDRLREFQRQVIQTAMAAAPQDWSDELKAQIVRAGWDLEEFAEAILGRQAAGDEVDEVTNDLTETAGTGTAVRERSWGQVKAEAAADSD
jgi:beta-lactamase regulating signal transducer with metallopeptidase domain/polyhydroxyalkanoate synthesis regulator phasin